MLNTAEAADHLGMSVSWLTKTRMSGTGPVFHKIGGAVRYRPADLDAWLDGQKRTQVYGFTANDNRPAPARRAA